MTANPDSALRQALVAAESALAPFAQEHAKIPAGFAVDETVEWQWVYFTFGDLRRAREAHALITEALQRGEKT